MTPGKSPGLHGQILDLDGHVMFDHEVVAELLGEELAGPLVRWMEPLTSAVTPQLRGDARARALDDIGSVKGFLALGAVEVDDRLLALDRLGIARQLILPPVSWPALDAPEPQGGLARGRYNAWISDWAATTDRLVPVAMLAMIDPDAALDEAEAIAAAGFAAVEVPFAFPPGGRSPGDAAWDPLWSLLADHEMSVVLHLGGAGPGAAVAQPRSFLDSGWFDIAHLAPPEFPASMAGLRENAAAGPVSLATLHLPAEVFCTSLILGGALERHPDLMVLVLEMGAQWVASWVERLDGVARSYKAYGLESLTSLPSEVIARQIRVTPFEANDVASWIERDGLSDVYAFASDYPHAEGGRDPIGRLSANLSRLAPETTRGFFVDNAAPILGRSTLVGRA